MAINVLRTGPSLGGNIGQAFGSALGAGLESLAQSKMEQLQKQNKIKGLEAIGYSPQEAQSLGALPDQLLNSELNRRSQAQNIMLKQNLKGAREQELAQALYGNQNQQAPQQQQNIPEGIQWGNAIANQFGIKTPHSEQPRQAPVATAPMAKPIPKNLSPQLIDKFVTHQERQQSAANATNKKYLDQLGEHVPTAERMLGIIKEMEDLRATGKVATGAKGKYVPLWLQSAETQQYNAKANELATLISDNSRGRPSAFRLKIAQTTKPSIEQDLLAQKGLEESVKEQAQKILNTRDIIDQIIQDNNGYQPANISSLVSTYEKQLQPNGIEQSQSVEPKRKTPEQQESHEETPLGTLARGLVRTGSRIGEALATNVGDIASTGLGAANYLTGGAIPTYEDIQKKLPISPPTSAQAQEFSEKATRGYTAPQSGTEEFIDNVVSTATKLIGGGGLPHLTKVLSTIISPKNAAKVARLILPFSGVSWQKGLGLSLAGESGAKAAETLGAGPTGQLASKFAFMLAAETPFLKGNIKSVMQNAYAESDKAAAGKYVNVSGTTKQLHNLYTEVVNGASPNKEVVKNIIEETAAALDRSTTPPSGKFPSPRTQTTLDKLIKLKHDVNEWYTKAERPQVPGEKHLPQGSRKYIGELNRIISEPINEYAKSNPDFGKPYALAEDLYRGVKDVDFINRWIDKHSSSTLSLKSFLPKALGIGAIGTGASHIAELSNLFIKHPAARIHYLEALKAASKGNVDAFKKHERAFEKEIK
jgi:hypothetical protein